MKINYCCVIKLILLSDMKFRLFAPLATTLTYVGYAIYISLMAYTAYQYVTVWSRYRWSDVNNPPDSTSYFVGRLSATEQLQTYAFQSFEYYLINHGLIIRPLIIAVLVALTSGETYSNTLYAITGAMCLLWCVNQILASIILYPVYLDCKNFWYCRLYNEDTPAIEFTMNLIFTVVDFGLSLVVLLWTVITRFEINSLKSREFALLGSV